MKYNKRHAVVWLLPAISAASANLDTASPIVDLGYATYQGIAVLDTVSNITNANFLGIRFAAEPTGTLRFARPQAPSATSGIQLADVQPNRCLAGAEGNASTSPFRTNSSAVAGARRAERRADVPGFSEDCLFLNVYVPGNLGQKKDLPVVVWIHGGGYVIGSASGQLGTDIYDGNDLVCEAGGEVVAVVIQYRLGLFGFLAGRKVKDGGALNAGLLDQSFALEWVQNHISKFGGDPTKVTIWGESAGAGSVLQHVVANGGNTTPPLFRAAITSSSYLPSQYKFDDPIPEALYSEVVSRTNCSSAADTLACLRTADVDTLEAANTAINAAGFFGTFVFVPVVDGALITDRPSALLQQGKLNVHVLYSVTNSLEGSIFVDATSPVPAAQYVAQVFPELGATDVARAAKLYDSAGLGSETNQAIAIMGESIFICPTYYMLRAFEGRSFKGEFAIPPASHGSDFFYYFPSLNADGVPPFSNASFDRAFAGSFLNFVLALNPGKTSAFDTAGNMHQALQSLYLVLTNSNQARLSSAIKQEFADGLVPAWQSWTLSAPHEMLFNETVAGAPDVRQIETSAALLKRCEFWQSVAEQTAQ